MLFTCVDTPTAIQLKGKKIMNRMQKLDASSVVALALQTLQNNSHENSHEEKIPAQM